MRAYEMLRREAEFARLRRRGRRIECKHFWLLAAPVTGRRRSRVGIVTAKAVGTAVVRNRIRRRVRALLEAAPPRGFDVIVSARPSAEAATFDELRGDLSAAFSRL